MADISYHCHHCGSVHELESIRDNLYLNQRSVASYASPPELPASHRAALRLRLALGIARALFPRYPRSAQH
jgi:hypothetical protein